MFDWLIRNALIVDGSGRAPYRGEVAIQDDRISGVATKVLGETRETLDANGRVAAPGFIDMHSHSDVLLMNRSRLEHKIWQGVTVEVIGQDGMSLAPLTESSTRAMKEMIEPLSARLQGEWLPWGTGQILGELSGKGLCLNAATYVGHCNLRLAAMGFRMDAPSPDQLSHMGRLLGAALEEGAVGLSLGLIYPPSSYAETAELVSLGKVLEAHDSLMTAHIRNEQEGLLGALAEMIRVGRESGCRIHISHLKCLGKNQWGKMGTVLEMLDRAAQEGIDVSFDQYPYTAACTSLSVLLPGWALDGGWDAFAPRVGRPEIRGKLLAFLKEGIEKRGGPSRIVMVEIPSDRRKRWVGKTLEEISRDQGISMEEAALEILRENRTEAVAIYHSMDEQDVERAMAHVLHTVGSDGILGSFPHPRTYGAFPRILGKYSRERHLFPLELAVRKMTSLPARRLRLEGRGCLEQGAFADVILFDPARFADRATYEDPSQFASGLDWMFVNGAPLVKEGRLQEVSPGKVLKPKPRIQ